jgi:hypothetical protein
MLDLAECKSMEAVTGLRIPANVCYGGIVSKTSGPRRSAGVRGDMPKHRLCAMAIVRLWCTSLLAMSADLHQAMQSLSREALLMDA